MRTFKAAVPILLLTSFVSGEDAPAVVSGEAGLSYVQTTGNSSNSTLGAALKLLRQAGAWKTGLSAAFVRTESDSVKTAERFDAALRAERGFGDGFAVYAQGSYLKSAFAGIEGQETFESGGLYKFANGPKHFFLASAALAHTAEQRIAPDRDRNFMGGRAALAYKWQLSGSADFTEDLDYLQSFKESGDGRLAHRAAVTANVSKIFALKLAHQLLYYNTPAPGKQTTDTTILASIVAKWPAPVPPPPPPCPCPAK